ncbi:sugar carrier protein C-like [Panicum miliaceum]|uniref:Sugar carrier protein C-like n=1 Tax=Panicum miliaceum TaxID=4540 RepID=A0A3L6THE2_PANMI|nr:sugar carrier protein C-like [Panicum miliaceum]
MAAHRLRGTLNIGLQLMITVGIFSANLTCKYSGFEFSGTDDDTHLPRKKCTALREESVGGRRNRRFTFSKRLHSEPEERDRGGRWRVGPVE